ncbi:UxaA family hydrolase [Paenibacillus doosanensis]|uniref:Altronate dehydratase n=1 Tax=Paenibacillus konkukensis TaxID=2020716 RepID=A0ABY4RGW4_9BACL|nr:MULTISPECIES: UxaA family hydrolase [Paenibacillus]MCS7460518.1 UxaA family hydrolase [Paenibacillus doosanensis]UQZ81260.1 Altronate dehydratase [Paenibacillus konkukensis]
MQERTQARRLLVLSAKDNTATALAVLRQGSEVTPDETGGGPSVILQDTIPFGHKFALTLIPAGQFVLKFGVPIGIAMSDIPAGAHIHLHNLRSMQQEGGDNEHDGVQKSGWKNRHT